LESRQIFDSGEKNKLLFSNIKVDPSISPFIKNRFEIISSSEDYSELLVNIKKENIHDEGFKAEYLVLHGDTTTYSERLKKLKDVGIVIVGFPNFETPTTTYAICNHQNIWHFGVLIKHNAGWQKHKKKPCSFSNSIGMNIGKTLVSIASKGNKAIRLLDACCGVGTVMLEACFSGLNIEGCDIQLRRCKHTRQNLAHYNYTANVYNSDIKDLDKKYDAAIVDLPYNLYSYSNDTILTNIIESTAKLATRIVIVSVSDVEGIIKKSGLKISDFCTVEKRGRSQFTRNIWVCEKERSSN
jgi:tRNA G10  N-methylase Trm11